VHNNQFSVENKCTAQRRDNPPYAIGKQIKQTFSCYIL